MYNSLLVWTRALFIWNLKRKLQLRQEIVICCVNMLWRFCISIWVQTCDPLKNIFYSPSKSAKLELILSKCIQTKSEEYVLPQSLKWWSSWHTLKCRFPRELDKCCWWWSARCTRFCLSAPLTGSRVPPSTLNVVPPAFCGLPRTPSRDFF